MKNKEEMKMLNYYTTEMIIDLTEECNKDGVWMKKIWIPEVKLSRLRKEIKDKSRELSEKINVKYGTFYPKDNDKEGWKLLGRAEGLAWVLVQVFDKQEKGGARVNEKVK